MAISSVTRSAPLTMKGTAQTDLQDLTKLLGLSRDQQDKIKPLLLSQAKTVQGLLKDKTKTIEERGKAIAQVLVASKEKIDAQLTDAQKSKSADFFKSSAERIGKVLQVSAQIETQLLSMKNFLLTANFYPDQNQDDGTFPSLDGALGRLNQKI